MIERWWLASRIAALTHLVAIVVLMVGSLAQVVRSAVDSSHDLHGYVLLFSALFAVILVVPLLILTAARGLIRRGLRAGLVILGVYVAVVVVLAVGTQGAAVVAVVVTIAISTLVVLVGTGICSWSEQQRTAPLP